MNDANLTPIALFAQPFYYLRHGETEANANRLIAGSLDVDLTALGREQAHAAARALVGQPITAVYSSPLKRARETAEPIAAALGLPITIVPEIAERNWGELEGKPRDTRVRGKRPAGSESIHDFRARILVGLGRIVSPAPLIVAHSGVFRALCHTLEIVQTEGPVANALPLRFVPLDAGAWKLEDVEARP